MYVTTFSVSPEVMDALRQLAAHQTLAENRQVSMSEIVRRLVIREFEKSGAQKQAAK